MTGVGVAASEYITFSEPSSTQSGAPPAPNIGNPGPPGAEQNGVPGGGSGCAPTELTALPDLGWTLRFLLPLQLVLAFALFRRRPPGSTGREEDGSDSAPE